MRLNSSRILCSQLEKPNELDPMPIQTCEKPQYDAEHSHTVLRLDNKVWVVTSAEAHWRGCPIDGWVRATTSKNKYQRGRLIQLECLCAEAQTVDIRALLPGPLINRRVGREHHSWQRSLWTYDIAFVVITGRVNRVIILKQDWMIWTPAISPDSAHWCLKKWSQSFSKIGKINWIPTRVEIWKIRPSS